MRVRCHGRTASDWRLHLQEGAPGLMGGVGESAIPTVVFQAWAYLGGAEYPCRLQADFTGRERILGRDVLNCLEILLRGPIREIVINP